jgi:hypothetical protein
MVIGAATFPNFNPCATRSELLVTMLQRATALQLSRRQFSSLVYYGGASQPALVRFQGPHFPIRLWTVHLRSWSKVTRLS